MGFKEFIAALELDADVVIDDVGPKRALSVPEALAVRDWWDRERRVPPKE